MILRLRESNYTLKQIGEMLDPPCTREAVRVALQRIDLAQKGLTLKRKVY